MSEQYYITPAGDYYLQEVIENRPKIDWGHPTMKELWVLEALNRIGPATYEWWEHNITVGDRGSYMSRAEFRVAVRRLFEAGYIRKDI